MLEYDCSDYYRPDIKHYYVDYVEGLKIIIKQLTKESAEKDERIAYLEEENFYMKEELTKWPEG